MATTRSIARYTCHKPPSGQEGCRGGGSAVPTSSCLDAVCLRGDGTGGVSHCALRLSYLVPEAPQGA
eukprot:7203088-Prymnesium_polylepis.1